ncbi:MAG: hypothetical protein KDD00_06470 [Ignavibacteriae bacterium]|nr:hypothetical protein [Ignavibacteriota bacterium]
MSTEVSLRDITTGVPVFYSKYEEARDNANDYDVISIYANIDEQIVLKNLVDVYIDPGTVEDFSGKGPTITDNGQECKCNISGGGIITNSYSDTDKKGCVEISNSSSEVNIECYRIENDGESSTSTGGATVDVISAARFSLICNRVFSKYNTAIKISDCPDFFLNITSVESGTPKNPNTGAPVLLIEADGSTYINELTCTGYGSCFLHKDGVAAATINKISTLQPDTETSTVANSTILLDAGTGDQDLVMYFDEIKNLNLYGGDAVKITEGKASLIGRSINCVQGKSLDLILNIVSAFIQCDEIISLSEGINIDNSHDAIVIEANYIEGSDGNDGVIKSASGSNYVLRNAKIKNTTSSSPSIGIYIDSGSSTTDQTIELENLIIITGTDSIDYSIFRDGMTTGIEIKNLGLFVKKDKNSLVSFTIGTSTNFKYIVSPDIT